MGLDHNEAKQSTNPEKVNEHIDEVNDDTRHKDRYFILITFLGHVSHWNCPKMFANCCNKHIIKMSLQTKRKKYEMDQMNEDGHYKKRRDYGCH